MATETITSHYVIQASRTTELTLLLNGLEAVNAVTVRDSVEQEVSIDMFQFLVEIESDESVDIEAEIDAVSDFALITDGARVDHKLDIDRV